MLLGLLRGQARVTSQVREHAPPAACVSKCPRGDSRPGCSQLPRHHRWRGCQPGAGWPARRLSQKFRQKERSESWRDRCASDWAGNAQGSTCLIGEELEALPFPDAGTWRKGLSPWGAVPVEMLENSLGEGVRSVRVPWDMQGAVKQASRPQVLGFVPTAHTWPDRGRQQPMQTQTTWVPRAAQRLLLRRLSGPHALHLGNGVTLRPAAQWPGG